MTTPNKFEEITTKLATGEMKFEEIDTSKHNRAQCVILAGVLAESLQIAREQIVTATSQVTSLRSELDLSKIESERRYKKLDEIFTEVRRVKQEFDKLVDSHDRAVRMIDHERSRTLGIIRFMKVLAMSGPNGDLMSVVRVTGVELGLTIERDLSLAEAALKIVTHLATTR